ncbi:hypothetical protein BKA62DRAFT_775785 [Auriculariales sp. MPI-PUGE-AT-0066]|nr:hypothetical protein BKA62DRAFT_775785 [Auriculariales sp. MPI-PUGE-AT-0066]
MDGAGSRTGVSQGRRTKSQRVFTADGHGTFRETEIPAKKNARSPIPEPPLNVYHLSGAKLLLSAQGHVAGDFNNSVERNFGIQDFYADQSAADIQHVEKLLSRLESDAAMAIRKIVDASEAGGDQVQLLRSELNTIRKFLFVMCYRNSRRAAQFIDDKFDAGTRADIDEHIRRYLPSGSTARDVWLQNIREILQTEYWEIPENPRILLHDRSDFENDMRHTRFVVWRANPSREFITADNGFGLIDYIMVPVSEQFQAARTGVMGRMRQQGSVASEQNIGHYPLCAHTWINLFPIHPRVYLALVDSQMASNLPLPFIPKGISLPPSRYAGFPMPAAIDIERVDHGVASPYGTSVPFFGNGPQQFYHGTMSNISATFDGKIMESRVRDVFTFAISNLTRTETVLVCGMSLENANQTLAFHSPLSLYHAVKAYESSTDWDHKKSYNTLKQALRDFYERPRSPDFEQTQLKTVEAIYAEDGLQVVWVCSVPKKLADPTPTEDLVEQFRRARIARMQH